MPLFKRTQSKREEASNTTNGTTKKEPEERMEPKARLVFHCQQAHGSPTGLISGFSNIKELYQKISECYDFPASEVYDFHNNFMFFFLLVKCHMYKYDLWQILSQYLDTYCYSCKHLQYYYFIANQN